MVLYCLISFILGFIIPIIFYFAVMRSIIKEYEIDYKDYINLQNENYNLKHKIYILKREIKKENNTTRNENII